MFIRVRYSRSEKLMARPRRPITAPRKAPSQERSAKLVAHILEAAVRVLEREGPHRFTTIRVAEKAGVSVGSLYQYFPNKQSILFRLQVEEWEKTGGTIDAILADTSKPPDERLRSMVRAFFRSECEEAPLRLALDAAAPSYHDAPEARSGRERSNRIVNAFVATAAPRATARQRAFAADFLFMTVTAIGKQLSERRPTMAEVDRWAEAVTQMLLGYLDGLTAKEPRRSRA
jgi:AcrR family transcriptional regulator